MNINDEYKEKEYECMTLVKSHKELFTYDKQNDIYYSRMFSLAIGKRRQLQKEIERHCKSENKEKVGKLFVDYNADDILVADYNRKGRCAVLPIALSFEGRNIEKQIEEQMQNRMNDKYISGTIEAQYDNYLSSEEAIDIYEEKSAGINVPLEDIEME